MERPGAALGRRPLHFILIVDCSGSMAADGKIQALNNAVRETLPHLIEVARENPEAELLVRCLAFSTGCRWHVATPTEPARLRWIDLEAGGYTDLGAALREVASVLRVPPLEPRALPPALLLVSDGQPTDDFEDGLADLMAEPWGEHALRVAIAIGRDAEHEVLQQFIGNERIQPFTANNPEQLVSLIRWTSTVAARAASELTVVTPLRFGPQPFRSTGDGSEVW